MIKLHDASARFVESARRVKFAANNCTLEKSQPYGLPRTSLGSPLRIIARRVTSITEIMV